MGRICDVRLSVLLQLAGVKGIIVEIGQRVRPCGTTVPKVEIFAILGAVFPSRWTNRREILCGHTDSCDPWSYQFHVNQCNESPMRGEMLIFGLWVNLYRHLFIHSFIFV